MTDSSTPLSAEAAANRSATGTDRSHFRRDIEGMRAIAVLAVMLWHAGVPWIPGGFAGVDVFFVISGFLMTTILLRDVDALGRIRIGRFYVRRIRRLLPAVTAALVGTALITIFVLPPVRWATVTKDIVNSALYVVNWLFAKRSTDYLAQGEAPSPVQHFWSLSIEEQFYLVLPVLLAILLWLFKTRRARHAAIAAVAVAGTVAGFAFGVWYTAAEPVRAYFVTPARAWELALGGVVAVAAVQLRKLNPRAASLLGWLGLAAVLTSLAIIDSSMLFPGAIAALPTLGTAAVLAAGLNLTPAGPVAVLRWAPLQRIGTLSYSLYLWHWPVLVAATVLYGDNFGNLSLPIAITALAASSVPAYLSYRYVEERWRNSRTPPPLENSRNRHARVHTAGRLYRALARGSFGGVCLD